MFAASQQRHQFSAFRLAQLNPVPYIHRLRYISMWSAAMDVGGWLRSLGLGQYEANFRDNKIDEDVLPQLTADDLKDIGVSAVGDRRRLLAAIAVLSGPTPSASTPASSPKPARTCMGLLLSSHFWRPFPSRPGSAPAMERNGGVGKPPAATRSAHFSARMARMASSGPSRE